MGSSERVIFIDGERGRLLVVLHGPLSPEGGSVPAPPLAILCNPMLEEKLVAQRVMVNLARRLARDGLATLRFDFMGSGDSEGDFEEADMRTAVSDLGSVVRWARSNLGNGPLNLVGLRWGASIAAVASSGAVDARSLVLVAPVVNGKDYLMGLLRSNLTFQMKAFGKVAKDRQALLEELNAGGKVNVDGYLMSKAMADGLDQLDLTKDVRSAPPDILLLNPASTRQPSDGGPSRHLAAHLEQLGSKVRLGTFEGSPFWSESSKYCGRSPDLEESVSSFLSLLFLHKR